MSEATNETLVGLCLLLGALAAIVIGGSALICLAGDASLRDAAVLVTAEAMLLGLIALFSLVAAAGELDG